MKGIREQVARQYEYVRSIILEIGRVTFLNAYIFATTRNFQPAGDLLYTLFDLANHAEDQTLECPNRAFRLPLGCV